jgi:hypothetical protein
MDGMQLPYVARCYRADVLDRPTATTDPGEDAEPTTDGPDDDMLLIDFH